MLARSDPSTRIEELLNEEIAEAPEPEAFGANLYAILLWIPDTHSSPGSVVAPSVNVSVVISVDTSAIWNSNHRSFFTAAASHVK